MNPETAHITIITSDVKQLIEQSRQNVALAVNAEITLLYWNIGKRINQEVLILIGRNTGSKLSIHYPDS